jgi:hypothetical protein
MDQRLVALYSELISDVAPYLNRPPVEVHGYGPPSYVKQFAARHLLDNVMKKFITHTKDADTAAFETFLASNKTCKRWVNPLTLETCTEADKLLIGQFSKIMEDFFVLPMGEDADLSWANICENARSGPGAAIGANGGSFYAKHFSSPLTATSQSVVNIYYAHNALYPEFQIAENIRTMEFGEPRIVGGSRTSFAPKTADVSRMICVEPGINMYLQLGLGSLIEKRLLRYFSIDLSVQPSINRWLAKIGSEQSDDRQSFATIDLSSASDSVSLGFVRDFIPPEWLSAILELRSPTTSYRGDQFELEMVSTMGNGFTFPLQTAIFSCIVAACSTLSDGSSRAASLANPSNDFSVFGDDIIVRRNISDRVLRLLSLLGFRANAEKTFQSGPFRESCGHDYICGHNVRPVFVRKIDTSQDIAVLINLFNEWSARTGIMLPRTCADLWRRFRTVPLFVPLAENMDAGVKIPLSSLEPLLLSGEKRIGMDSNLSIVYKRWVGRPPRIRFKNGTVHVPRRERRLIYNPPGLLQAYLRGEIRGGAITIRGNSPLPYDAKRAISPWWDYMPKSHEELVFGLALDKVRLMDAILSNIGHLIRYPQHNPEV